MRPFSDKQKHEWKKKMIIAESRVLRVGREVVGNLGSEERQSWNSPGAAVVVRNLEPFRSRTDIITGLRPLLNLSQTCFLSAILQSLLHNPLLKAYFLSDKHNRHVCANGSRGLAVGKPYTGLDNGNGNGSGNGEGREREKEKGCMCCEMDRAFEEVRVDETTTHL